LRVARVVVAAQKQVRIRAAPLPRHPQSFLAVFPGVAEEVKDKKSLYHQTPKL